MNGIWITWEHQLRNISMANLLECEYVELSSNRSRLFRYISLSYKTFKIIFSSKSEVVFFQNPSIVLGLVCVISKIFSGKKFVGDFHNVALEKGRLYFLNKFISKNIDLTVVSNRFLFSRINEMGGKPFCFPDPIPMPPTPNRRMDLGENNKIFFVFISSWADDEPVNAVLDAFIESGLYNARIELHVTGRVKKNKLVRDIAYYTQHGIRFLGYVSEEQYWICLSQSALNIDLTMRENCLVCGAYESVSLAAPVLLSNNQASIEYFGEYALFTDNSVRDLVSKFHYAINQKTLIKINAEENKLSFLKKDKESKESLRQVLHL